LELTIFNSFNFKKVDATRPKDLLRIFLRIFGVEQSIIFQPLASISKIAW